MPIIAVPWSEYSCDQELRALWHNILSNPTLLSKLPTNTWHGFKLQEILWSGKINEKEKDWEETLVRLWKE
jgi:hypothetical protein